MDIVQEAYTPTVSELNALWELQELQSKQPAQAAYSLEYAGIHRTAEEPAPLFEVGIDSAETITAVQAEQARSERLRNPHFPSGTVGVEDYTERAKPRDAAAGPIGSLAMIINAPGKPADYQTQFDQREISRTDFVMRMATETAQARMDSVRQSTRQAGAFVARAFKGAREAVTSWGKEVPRAFGSRLGSTAMHGTTSLVEDTIEFHTV